MLETLARALLQLHEAMPAVPVVEVRECTRRNHMGFCHCEHSRWRESASGLERFAQESVCRWISVRTVSEEDGSTPLPLATTMLVLLHECAHAVAPCRQTRRRSSAKWTYDAHDDGFYRVFADILRVAERIGLFALPKRADKLSLRNLRRFDSIDLEAAPISGAVVMVGGGGPQEAPSSWRFTLSAQGSKKPVLLRREDVSVDAVLKLAKQKMRFKGTSLRTTDGSRLDTCEKLEAYLDSSPEVTVEVTKK